MTVTGRNRRFVEGFYGALEGDLVDAFSGEEMVRAGEMLVGSVTDDFECLMVGPFEAYHYPGLPGFGGAWREWVEPYSRFYIQVEAIEEREDNVLMLVTQRGVTRHDEVEIENASAAVWRFRDQKLARVEFYLDRDAAREAFEPTS